MCPNLRKNATGWTKYNEHRLFIEETMRITVKFIVHAHCLDFHIVQISKFDTLYKYGMVKSPIQSYIG